MAVAISTSGGSRNVIAALEEARKRGLLTVALLGYDGGEIGAPRPGRRRYVVVRSDYIPRIQEVQASIYHVMRESLEAARHDAVRAVRHAGCPYTRDMREWLEARRRRLRRVRRRGRPGRRAQRMRALAGGQRTVPVLVEDGRVVQVGWQGRGCVVSE